MYAMMLSAGIAAAAGGLYAVILLVVTPLTVFGALTSAQALIVALFGGVGVFWGPIIGAAILVPAEELFKNTFAEAHLLIYGILIVIVVLFVPDGIVGSVVGVARWWRIRRSRAP
jgi:branched-chain amino acid transport system permease protein